MTDDETLLAGISAGEVCSQCESWDDEVTRYPIGEGVTIPLCPDCAFESFTDGLIEVDVSRTRAGDVER